MKKEKLIFLVGILCFAFVSLAGCSKPLKSSLVTDTEECPASNITWVSPGNVKVDNYDAGKTVEYWIRVHNGNNYDAEFSIFTSPQLIDWVNIVDTNIVIPAQKTMQIPVVLKVPKNSILPDKWEFLVIAKQTSQSGFINIENASTWSIYK